MSWEGSENLVEDAQPIITQATDGSNHKSLSQSYETTVHTLRALCILLKKIVVR